MPNRTSDGTRIGFRPKRSASTPSTGVKKIPGSVKIVISQLICEGVAANACPILGSAGVRLETPIMAIRVILKTISKLGFTKTGRGLVESGVILCDLSFIRNSNSPSKIRPGKKLNFRFVPVKQKDDSAWPDENDDHTFLFGILIFARRPISRIVLKIGSFRKH